MQACLDETKTNLRACSDEVGDAGAQQSENESWRKAEDQVAGPVLRGGDRLDYLLIDRVEDSASRSSPYLSSEPSIAIRSTILTFCAPTPVRGSGS